MRKRAWGALAVATILVAGCGESSDESELPDGFNDLPAESYYLGTEFDGLPLTDVLPPERGAGGSTSFFYGDCDPPAGEGGCAPPMEAQTWAECSRPPPAPLGKLTEVRGALVQEDPRESKVEVLTGHNTVVIFGSASRAAAAVDALRQRDDAQPIESFEPPGC